MKKYNLLLIIALYTLNNLNCSSKKYTLQVAKERAIAAAKKINQKIEVAKETSKVTLYDKKGKPLNFKNLNPNTDSPFV